MLNHRQINRQRQLMRISKWPAEQDAWRLLRIVGKQKTPGMFRIPALVALLFWALEESGDEAGKARQVLQTLLVTVPDSPAKAVRMLLNLDGEEETATHPDLMNAATKEEAARVILSLANQVERPS